MPLDSVLQVQILFMVRGGSGSTYTPQYSNGELTWISNNGSSPSAYGSGSGGTVNQNSANGKNGVVIIKII